MTEHEKQHLWDRGLDLLAKAVGPKARNTTRRGYLFGFGDVAELLDKLLIRTGLFPDFNEVAWYLNDRHHWSEFYAEQAAAIVVVVAELRRHGSMLDLAWPADLADQLKQGASLKALAKRASKRIRSAV